MSHQVNILRAARAYLDMHIKDVAEQSGVTYQTISNLENNKNAGTDRTLIRLRKVYEDHGIVFTGDGLSFQPYKTAFYDSFIDVLDEAAASLKKGDELLLHCADERRNMDGVEERFNALRDKGIRIRMTCEEGNDYITGPKQDYRWIDPELFASSQVEVIFGDKYFFHIQDQGRNIFVMTNNRAKADAARRQFEYNWKRGKKWANAETT